MVMMVPFQDRREAGQQLAQQLTAYANRPDVVVLALPRGGVPVAYEVARALGAPLDVFIVRKVGVPGYEELAMGAVATGGVRVLNQSVVQGLQIPDSVIDTVTTREQQELARRERLYRGGRRMPDMRGKTAILVDDGLATGSTMQAAVTALRAQHPAKIVVAVPIASREACDSLREIADEVVCAMTPEPFGAVGRFYQDFTQTSDDEVRDLLERRTHLGEQAAGRGPSDLALAEHVRSNAYLLTGTTHDYDPLLERIGDARYVLLGEASHGTDEFYRERAEITKRLIQEKGFTAVAVEADWPDAYRVNRYVRGVSEDINAIEALSDFRRFPTWMWRNTVMVQFATWLREYNDSLPEGSKKRGFYGLDLYSLHTSMKAVIEYLEKVDPKTAAAARERYSCFDRIGEEAQIYGLLVGTGASKSCEEEVIRQLVELETMAMSYARRDGRVADDELFFAEQNARVVKNAEAYYRQMFLRDVSTWNLRDHHMMDTLEALAQHLGTQDQPAKVVVWAHNSHLGDARFTDMGERGEFNLGQLVRKKFPADAVLVGFTTHHGTVTAASDWGERAERKLVRPALPGSYELTLHDTGLARFLLIWRDSEELAKRMRDPQRLERAIGVIYRPETERMSHYFGARISEQFDAVLHFDETLAVEPLERTSIWDEGEVPETFPFAV